MILYCIYNSITGKRYIGLTTMSLSRRWYFHVDRAVREKTHTVLSQAIRKYGSDAFIIEEVCALVPGGSVEDLKQLEIEMIAQENTLVPSGYNMTLGGDSTFGFKYTKEQLEARKYRKVSPETKAKMSAAHKGKKHSTETLRKMSDIAKTKNMNRAKSGHKHTAQTKKKFSDAWTPIRREKAKAAMLHAQKSRWSNSKVIPIKEAM